MANEKKVTLTFMNGGKNPLIVKNAEGKDQRVAVGGLVEITPEMAATLKIEGFQDISKMVKPTGETEALRTENAALKKELVEVKAKLAKAEKDLESALL